MDSNPLYPPNLNKISNAVIAPVMQHARRLPHQTDSQIGLGNGVHSVQDCSTRSQSPASGVSVQVERTTRFGSISRHKCSLTQNSIQTPTPFGINRETIEMVRAQAQTDLELRRIRNRMHQAKHKMKQQQKLVDLEGGIRQLRDEIQQLKIQKEVISACISTNMTVWNVAAEYFRLFRNGYKGPIVTLQPTSMENPMGSLQPRESFAQRDFFIATMAEDVASDTGFGVESLLNGWRRLSMCNEDMEIELVRLNVGLDNDLIATVRSATTMSEKALRHGFPHLLKDGQWTSLGARLLGQRIVMHGAVSFVWNKEKGRVVSLQCSVDMMTPMMQLLGNLKGVTQVFAHAQVTPDSRLVVN